MSRLSSESSLHWIRQAATTRRHQRRSQADVSYVGREQWRHPERLDREWLVKSINAVTSHLTERAPSTWAEESRYLPSSVSTIPGKYSFGVTPYFREILDCMDPRSPVRQVALMKGVQIGATVGVLENSLGYAIAEVRNAPCMLVTADKGMAKGRMDGYVVPMLIHSNLSHLIKSQDALAGNRKSGKTEARVEWVGGGSLIPQGAKNADTMRSWSIQYLWFDECDTYPLKVGRDGDPIALCMDRTAAYEFTRKIFALSTPLEADTSRIAQLYGQGDKRKYMVRCLECETQQQIAWRGTNNETGEEYGIRWSLDNLGHLIPESVQWVCVQCGHGHMNYDKTKLLAPEYGAEWVPTAVPEAEHIRSYHLSALYSHLTSWEAVVRKWMDAWDVENNRMKDVFKLQVFYNNYLARTFKQPGESVAFQRVSSHRRDYEPGIVPNVFAEKYSGSPIQLVTCAVDLGLTEMAVACFGWTKGRRAYLLKYDKWYGDTEQLDDPETWGKLREFLETGSFPGDNGWVYMPTVTLIDSGFRTDQVYSFAAEYSRGVFPIKGQDVPPKSARHKEFSEFVTPMGTRAFGVTVDVYKDRWKAGLNRQWDGLSQQPMGFFNTYASITDKELRELTVESKREKLHSVTRQKIGYEWYRPSGAANELWDLLVYNNAALDLTAWDVCRNQYELEIVDWEKFWQYAEATEVYVSK